MVGVVFIIKNYKKITMNLFSLKDRLRNNIFLNSIIALTAGSSLAQIISIASQPVITRLYTPEVIGAFSSLVATISLWTVISTGRYELAIVLPHDKKEAKAVVYICFIIALVISCIVCIYYLCKFIYVYYIKMSQSKTLYLLLFIAPLVLINAFESVFMRIAVREKKIRELAISQVTKQLVDKCSKILLGFFSPSPISLIIAAIAGQMTRVYFLMSKTFISFFKSTDKVCRKDIIFTAKQYKKFPLIDTWSGFLDMASGQLPVIMFASFFSDADAGYYALCVSILYLPMGLIGSSIANVYSEKIARLKDDNEFVKNLTMNLFKKLIFIGTLGMSFVIIYGDLLFKIVFGSKWEIAGIYSMIKAPSIAVVLAFSPVSCLCSIYDRLEESFLLGLVSFITAIGAICGSFFLGYNALYTVIFLSIVNLIVNIWSCCRILKIIKISYIKTLITVIYISIPIYAGQWLLSIFIRSWL